MVYDVENSETSTKSEPNSVMHWFGKQDLGYKYAMGLGCLIVLTFLAGLAKLMYNRHRTKKFAKNQSIAKSPAKEELHNLNKRELDEGDLFGIRALESGFYGGVAQSRPATPISGGSSSLTLVAPRSAHVSHRTSSDTGYLKPANSNSNIGLAVAGPGRDAVDMHLIVPPSPTHSRNRDRDEVRSPSPTGSTHSQNTPAPRLELGPLPSSGLNIQTHSNKPISPRIQVKAPSPIVTHPHSSAIFSQRGSVIEAEKTSPKLLISPNTPPKASGSSEKTFVAWSTHSAQSPPSIPRVVVEDSWDETDSRNKGKASGPEELFLFTGSGYGPNRGDNYGGVAPRPNAGSLARRTSEKRGDNRASNASFAEFYDSYYDNRLSMAREEDEYRI